MPRTPRLKWRAVHKDVGQELEQPEAVQLRSRPSRRQNRQLSNSLKVGARRFDYDCDAVLKVRAGQVAPKAASPSLRLRYDLARCRTRRSGDVFQGQRHGYRRQRAYLAQIAWGGPGWQGNQCSAWVRRSYDGPVGKHGPFQDPSICPAFTASFPKAQRRPPRPAGNCLPRSAEDHELARWRACARHHDGPSPAPPYATPHADGESHDRQQPYFDQLPSLRREFLPGLVSPNTRGAAAISIPNDMPSYRVSTADRALCAGRSYQSPDQRCYG